MTAPAAYLRTLRRLAAVHGAEVVLRDVAAHLTGPAGAGGPGLLETWDGDAPEPATTPPPALATPDLLGWVYECLLDRDWRRRAGAFYTPAALADELTRRTLVAVHTDPELRICDPAVGGGALLLAALRWARACHPDSPRLRLTGVDLDPLAVSVARTALALAGAGAGVELLTGDALDPRTWPPDSPGSFDAVLANPPFLSQLTRRTARTRSEAVALGQAFGPVASGYADSAMVFGVLAVQLVRPGGSVGLILPDAVLAARDGARSRTRIAQQTRLRHVWLAPPETFGAGIRACAVSLRRHGSDAPWVDPETVSLRDRLWASGSWAPLAADLWGVPDCEVRTQGRVADIARCTADFRAQFYGVASIAVDQAIGDRSRQPPLLTSGLIDLLDNRWGRTPARLGGRRFTHPRADLEQLGPEDPLRRWAAARLVPKVLLATQTRVLEAVVDPDGELLPVVPVISVTPTAPDRIWHLAAVLACPPITAIAGRLSAGSALSRHAIKLSARQVADLPLPAEAGPWDVGAMEARAATVAARTGDEGAWRSGLDALGAAMCDAYGVEADTVVPWWAARLRSLSSGRNTGRRVSR